LYELLWTIIRRLARGQSPFKPDSEHLHHLVLKAGFGVRGTFVVLTTIASVLALFGIAAEESGLPDAWSFGLLAVVGVVVVRLMYRAELLWKLLPSAMGRFRLVP